MTQAIDVLDERLAKTQESRHSQGFEPVSRFGGIHLPGQEAHRGRVPVENAQADLATLLIGLVSEDAGTRALGLAGVVAALIVVWAGVVRISGSSQGHRQR